MNKTSLLLAQLALLAGLSACLGRDPGVGTAQLTVKGAALSIDDITRVEITISGPGIATPLVQDLAGDATAGWSGTISDIPAGAERRFTGRAYDGVDLIYEGEAYPVDVPADDMVLVTIFMQQVDPPTPFYNSAPRITALSVSSYTVDPDGTISLTVTAEDPDPGDTLTYAWSAGSGSFSAPSAAATDWTASAAPGSVNLHIAVADDSGATATLEIAVQVNGSGGGSAFVAVDVNTAPEILSLVPSPTQIDRDDYTYLDLSASDPDGDSLSYEWDVEWPCEGYFDDSTIEDATFTLSDVDTEWDDCVLTVTVRDGRGGVNTASLAIATGPGVCDGGSCGSVGPLPGELIWENSRNHFAYDGATAGDVTFDPIMDMVVVVSNVLEIDNSHMMVDLYTSGGVFVDSILQAGAYDEMAFSADTDATGIGYVAGWSSDGADDRCLLRQQFSGWMSPGWQVEVEGLGYYDLEIDSDGDPVVVGITGAGPSYYLTVSRFDGTDGPFGAHFDQAVHLGTIHEGAGLDIDLSGNVVVCASYLNGGEYDLWLGKFDGDLNEIFTATWGAGNGRDEFCEDLATDGFGNIFVAGGVVGTGDLDWWVAKFGPAGSFIDEVVVDDGGAATAQALTVAPNGIVYVSGETDAGGLQAMLRAYRNTLLDLWQTSPGGADGAGVALNPDGDVLYHGIGLNEPWVGLFAH